MVFDVKIFVIESKGDLQHPHRALWDTSVKSLSYKVRKVVEPSLRSSFTMGYAACGYGRLVADYMEVESRLPSPESRTFLISSSLCWVLVGMSPFQTQRSKLLGIGGESAPLPAFGPIRNCQVFRK